MARVILSRGGARFKDWVLPAARHGALAAQAGRHAQDGSAVVHELVFGHWRYDSFIEGTHESARYHTQGMTPLMGCE